MRQAVVPVLLAAMLAGCAGIGEPDPRQMEVAACLRGVLVSSGRTANVVLAASGGDVIITFSLMRPDGGFTAEGIRVPLPPDDGRNTSIAFQLSVQGPNRDVLRVALETKCPGTSAVK